MVRMYSAHVPVISCRFINVVRLFCSLFDFSVHLLLDFCSLVSSALHYSIVRCAQEKYSILILDGNPGISIPLYKK